MSEASGYIRSLLDHAEEYGRHRAPDPRGTSWAVLEVSGHVLEAVILLGGGLVIGFLLGGMMLACGR